MSLPISPLSMRSYRLQTITIVYTPLIAWDMEYQMPYIRLLLELLAFFDDVRRHCLVL